MGAKSLSASAVPGTIPKSLPRMNKMRLVGAQLSTILVEQALIHAHIPFDLIFDKDLPNLAKYYTLVLPPRGDCSECQSPACG